MGQSTNGQICYGISFEDGFQFPWNEVDKSIEAWWREDIMKFKPSFEIYADTETGYINNIKPEQSLINKYYKEKNDFKELHPCPIEEVNTCSGDYPMYILALTGTCQTANRGCPETFDPTKLVITDEQKNSLIEFCKTHGIEFEGEPAWYLSSYWG